MRKTEVRWLENDLSSASADRRVRKHFRRTRDYSADVTASRRPRLGTDRVTQGIKTLRVALSTAAFRILKEHGSFSAVLAANRD
jgi:hypothetical protein